MFPRPAILLVATSFVAVLPSCERTLTKPAAVETAPPAQAEPAVEVPDLSLSVLRVHATRQEWNAGQPWEKLPPARRSSLGAVVGKHQVLTTAEMAADATMIELETSDGLHLAPAEVIAVDYAANLALLTVKDEEEAAKLFKDLKPVEIADALPLEAELDIVQVEDNGNTLVTPGSILGVDVTAPYLPGEFFLTYRVKASMQTAASSFTLPTFANGKLAGILNTYDSEDQVSEILASPVIDLFLKDAADGDYLGFPALGVSVATTEDPHFRNWLKLPEDGGGLYLAKVRPEGPAAKAGVIQGDVLMAIDDAEIDNLLGKLPPKKEERTVIYARVSSTVNKTNLETQKERLISYCNAHGWKVDRVITEFGSGLNDRRPKLEKLLHEQDFSRIVVEHKDRLTRFGFNYLEVLLAKNNITIEVVNPAEPGNEDLVQDFISVITSFCARIYGQRRSKRKTEELIKNLEADETINKDTDQSNAESLQIPSLSEQDSGS